MHLLSAIVMWAAASVAVSGQELFVRDHAVLARPVRWGDAWAVSADRAYLVPLGSGELRPITHPALDLVLDVAESSPNVRLLFGIRGTKATLLSLGSKQGSRELALPAVVAKGVKNWRLAASASRVALFDGRVLLWCELSSCRWSKVELTRQLMRRRREPDQPRGMVIVDDEVLVAIDNGEWGGGLWSVNTRTGKASLVENDDEPATGVTVDRLGRVWATWGQSHMIAAQGTLRVRERAKWRVVARSDNMDRGRHQNWSLETTAFESVAVVDDRVFLLTNSLGVVEMRNGWSVRTKDWPGHQYLTGLAISGDTAIIVSYDAVVPDLEPPHRTDERGESTEEAVTATALVNSGLQRTGFARR